jgi:hypothetical protein
MFRSFISRKLFKVMARHNSLESSGDANQSSTLKAASHILPTPHDLEYNGSFSSLNLAQSSQSPLDEALLASNRHMEVADCIAFVLSH